ncbi:TRAP transporter small permease subunit [Alisedimentitalea sp. MJ-SS2]|uniref:TRAP transporter small permease n=1 Tax=Aliisedimentitalea sp. MJ-SS2 TaxID=3049795 RepID=UPI0029118DF7|nr:TRAP transporter small permease subunit [Alisedimentitalea sp. MJ-SS2]MDU8927303.1 TRAP transporter small permease subunit [Alisedimentitalea sp. MJ-SS2]
MAALRTLRSGLDFLYKLSELIAALCMIAILVLIVMQMLARWSSAIFPGAPEYAAYCMAAASFFGFAAALNRGSHIRVSLLLNAVGPRMRRFVDIWCFGVAAVTMWYFVLHARQFVYWSWKFKEVSQSEDATMLWIPQSVMVIGGVLLAIALTDNLLHLIFTGKNRINHDAIEPTQEV